MPHQSKEMTRQGEVFAYPSLEAFLLSREFSFPKENYELTKEGRIVCIDDGILVENQSQEIIPFSGSGAGEDEHLLQDVLADGKKIKAHKLCGKAGLVLGGMRAELGKPTPTQEEVDQFAEAEAARISAILGIELGRTIGVNDERKTSLRRPEDKHLATGAVIGLSRRFLHNLITPEVEKTLPMYFRVAGYFLGEKNFSLVDKVADECWLANQIASGHHGVGIIPQGFTYTALVDLHDERLNEKIAELDIMWNYLDSLSKMAKMKGQEVNSISHVVLGYNNVVTGNTCTVTFSKI